MAQGQQTYLQEFPVPFVGQIDHDGGTPRLRTLLNKTGGTYKAGLAVKLNPTPNAIQPGGSGGASGTDEAVALSATGDAIAAITTLDYQTDPDNTAGSANFNEGVVMKCLEAGNVWVGQDFALAGPTDPVYVRFAAGAGTLNVPGAFGNTADNGTCRLVPGATWKNIGTGVAGSPAMLYIDVATDAAVR